MSIFDEELEQKEIEKGLRTVTVPPSNGRIGYQYQRNFPDEKMKTKFKGKNTKSKQERILFEIRRLLKEINSNTDNAERKIIKNKIKGCSQKKICDTNEFYYNEKRDPAKKGISKDEQNKFTVEFEDAKKLALKGFKVYLPDENDGNGTYDAVINGVPFDFKNIIGGLETIKKQSQKGFKQARSVVLFFESRTSIDYMKYAAMMNGATNTSKNKNATLFYFNKENELEYFDMRKVKKNGDYTKSIISQNFGFITSDTSILPQSTKKSIKNTFVEINIKDVTEGNKQAKIDCLEKAFYEKLHFGKALVEYVPDDNTKKLKDIVTLKIRNFDGEKLNKAVRTLSFSLDTPLKTPKGELFAYKSQEDLTNKITAELTEKTKALYSFLIGYFGLPEMRIVTKADLTYRGKILYSPETGKPITQKEWKDFVDALERFLNRNYNGMGEKIVLSSEALGRILERMLKTNTLEAIREKRLDDIKYKSHNLEWISDSVKNMTNTFGESLSRYQQARIQVMTHSAAQRIQSVTDAERNKIQQILIDGVKNKQSKSVISQSLFDSCIGMNRDLQRIADSEIQDAAANAYIQEAVYNSKQGEKVYFKRFEMLDDNTCPRCKALRGMVVLYSDNPLPSSKIKDEYADYAIWEGSGINNKDDIPIGIAHPWCRGSWYRYYPKVEEM